MSKQASRQRSGKQRAAQRSPAQPDKASPGAGKDAGRKNQPSRGGKQRKSRPQQARRRGRSGRGRGHIGFAGMRRSRRQRIGITAVVIGGLAALWVPAAIGALDVGLAIAMSVLLLVALPAFVVLVLGRRY